MANNRDVIPEGFSYAGLADNILKFTSKGALIDALHTLTPGMIHDLIDINKCLVPKYEEEIDKIKKGKSFKKDNTVTGALYSLKISDPEYNFDSGFKSMSEIIKGIQNNDLITDDENITTHLGKLADAETNTQGLSLYGSFVKSNYFHYLRRKKKMKVEDILKKTKTGRSLYHYYLSFYDLILRYNFLLRLNLSFSTISRNIKEIKSAIYQDVELADVCRRKIDLPYFLQQ